MEDDELLSEIKDSIKKSKNTFESVINKKSLSKEELEALLNPY